MPRSFLKYVCPTENDLTYPGFENIITLPAFDRMDTIILNIFPFFFQHYFEITGRVASFMIPG